MIRNRRKLRIVALGFLGSVALVACGSEQPDEPSPAGGGEEAELDWELDDALDPDGPACPESDPECDALDQPCELADDAGEVPGSELMGGITDPKTESGKYRAWPNGRIPYVYATDASGKILSSPLVQNKLSAVMTEYETLTEGRIKFVAKTSNDAAYLRIKPGSTQVRPFIGYRAGQVQILQLDQDEYKTVMRHELGHVIGLHHEQKRKDRDDNIFVNTNNIKQADGCPYQYSICWNCELLGADYGLTSVMQYRTRDLPSCRIDSAKAIVKHLNGDPIGHDWTIRTTDLNSIAKMYGASCSPETNAQFCARLAKNCGSVSGDDNCGTARSVDCGSCSTPETCGGGGAANVCGSSESVGWGPIPEGGSLVTHGICADVTQGSTADGATVVTWGCHGAGNQSWRITKNGQLKVSHSLKCASVVGSAVAGATVEQESCSATALRQHWQLNKMEIVNGKNGGCMHVPNGEYFSGQSLAFTSCNGSSRQKFDYRPNTEELKAGGYCVTPRGGAEAGNDVILRPCDGRLSQRWFQGRGGFVNRANTGQCMRVQGGADRGATIEVADCNDALGQRWALRGEVREPRANLCLQGSSSWGTELELAACNGGSSQQWTFWSR